MADFESAWSTPPNGGARYRTVLRVTVASQSIEDNTSMLSWVFFIEKDRSSQGYYGFPATRSVVIDGSTRYSGSGNAPNAPWTGTSTWTLASGTYEVEHDPDGSKVNMPVAATYVRSGSGWAPGTMNVSGSMTLPKLTAVPSVPTGVSAVRVSDSSATVSWSQSSPSNGQPTSNTVQRRVNGGSPQAVVTISPATSVGVDASANQKIEYRVRASNAAGDSAWSAWSPPIYTSPAAPTNVAAVKDASLDITVSWTPNVAFSEHEHVIEHSEDGGGYSALTVVASGTSTYKHVDPDPAKTHRYRVQARNTATGALTSAWVQSNTVQLLAAPNKPTLGVVPAFANKAADLVVAWTHNPVDSSAQTAYEFRYSTNGGSSWSTTGKQTSTTPARTIAGGTYSADDELTVAVRTWGQATTGGSDGTGASPWSDSKMTTFKTLPVATITAPADSSTYDKAALNVQLGFSQAEGSTFVQATIGLYDDAANLLEQVVSTTLASTVLATRVVDGENYELRVVVLDSNGLTSAQVTSAFSVSYTLPVAAQVTVTYMDDSGWAQVDVTLPAPGGGEVAAVSVDLLRTINGVTEAVHRGAPAESSMALLDTTPTINGENVYTVVTHSEDGAEAEVQESLVTTERARAFLSTGPGFSEWVSLVGDLEFSAAPGREHDLVKAALRKKPLALFGEQTDLVVSGSVTTAAGLGSTLQEIEEFLLTAGIVCYRDPSGRRMFGVASGSTGSPKSVHGNFQYRVVEAT